MSVYRLNSPSECNFPASMENRNYGGHNLVFDVRLEKNGGALGITLAGSEELHKPIVISGLLEDGVAFNTGQIQIGDCLLAINGENVQDLALSHATKLLQNLGDIIDLKLSRNITGKYFIFLKSSA